MIAYKLMRLRRDNTLGSLFINKKESYPIGKWLIANEIPTKGYKVRKGWHCTLKPNAPHLSTNKRVWVKVEVEDFSFYERPESQGGTWVLANKMKIIGMVENTNVTPNHLL